MFHNRILEEKLTPSKQRKGRENLPFPNAPFWSSVNQSNLGQSRKGVLKESSSPREAELGKEGQRLNLRVKASIALLSLASLLPIG